MTHITFAQALIASALLAAGAPAPAPAQSDGTCAVAGKSPCVIELHGPHAPKMSANCSAQPWSKYLRFMLPDTFADSNKDGWWETVVELALDPSKECGCAKIRIDFEDPVDDWVLNIGDSPTNNGLGGDAGTTNYAAEMQIRKAILSVFTVATPKLAPLRFDTILDVGLPPLGGRHADLEICDQLLAVDVPAGLAGNRPFHWRFQTPLYRLLYSFAPRSGLLGSEGGNTKDKGLYAGFNRVIHDADKVIPTRGTRIGTGVRRVELTLYP